MGSLTDIEKQTIVDMKQSGAKLKDIVAETGRNSITIRNYLTSQGFPLYNKRISNDEKELIIKLFESGLNCSQIANQMVLNTSLVPKVMILLLHIAFPKKKRILL